MGLVPEFLSPSDPRHPEDFEPDGSTLGCVHDELLLGVIDATIAGLGGRALVATDEVADMLLDLRNVVAGQPALHK